jgi:hypothetical protein
MRELCAVQSPVMAFLVCPRERVRESQRYRGVGMFECVTDEERQPHAGRFVRGRCLLLIHTA